MGSITRILLVILVILSFTGISFAEKDYTGEWEYAMEKGNEVLKESFGTWNYQGQQAYALTAMAWYMRAREYREKMEKQKEDNRYDNRSSM